MKHAGSHLDGAASATDSGDRLQRINLTCWPMPGDPPKRRLHTLGCIITSDDGSVDFEPYHDRDGDHMWREGDRLAFICYKCRRGGRSVSGSVQLTRALTLSAWLAFTEAEAGVLAPSVEVWVSARSDALARKASDLARVSSYNLGRDEVLSYKHRLFEDAGLAAHEAPLASPSLSPSP